MWKKVLKTVELDKKMLDFEVFWQGRKVCRLKGRWL